MKFRIHGHDPTANKRSSCCHREMNRHTGPLHRPKTLWLTIFLSFLVQVTFAHDPGLSTLNVKVTHGGGLEAFATFARKDIEPLLLVQRGMAPGNEDLAQLAPKAIVIEGRGRLLQPTASSARFGDQNDVQFRFSFRLRTGGNFTICSPLIRRLAPGHRQLISVTNAAGNVVEQRLLSAGMDHAEVVMDLANGSVDGNSTRGMKHTLVLVTLATSCCWLIQRQRNRTWRKGRDLNPR
jgi:hypothetical protein